MNATRLLWTLLFVVALSNCAVLAQTNVNEEKGMKPYDSWHGGDLDSISMTNGGLVLHIPLASFPQRGNLDLSFAIYANTKQWKMWINPFTCADPTDPNGCTPHWIPTVRGQQFGGAGPVEGAYVTSSIDWIPQNVCDGISDLEGNVLWNWSASLIAPDGNVHTFGAGDSSPYGCPATPLRALDASGILQADANTIIFPNGTRFNFPNYPNPTTFTDANGNRISVDANVGTYTDTMGRSIIPPVAAPASDVSACPSGTASAKAWTIPGLAGGTRTFKFCYSTISIFTNFGQGGIEYGPTNNTLLTAVVLPDSTMWTLAYDHYGDITRVGFPTGGSISYTYQMGPVTCNVDGSTPLSMIVASRTVDANDGTGGHTWNYTYTAPSNSTSGTMVVTSPSPELNDTVHTIGNPFNGTAGCSLVDLQVQNYQGSRNGGTLLRTAATQYSAAPYNLSLSLTTINTVPTQATVTWADGHTSRAVNTWDSGNTETLYGASVPVVLGSLLQHDEYDFSNSLVRSTVNHYLWQDNATYKSNNFLGLKTFSMLKDSAGCEVAKTSYGYDETYNSIALQPSGVTMQHVAAPATVRGNRTSENKWLISNACVEQSAITSHVIPYDTGQPYQSYDPLQHMTKFTYDPAFYGAYLTRTDMPDTQMPDAGAPLVHHVISGNYDFNTGLLTSFTDENSQVYTYTYEPLLLRLTQGNHPDTGITKLLYPDPNTVERQRLISGTTYDDFKVKFDGVGRSYQTQGATPSGIVLTDTTYDSVGRVNTVSNPYYQGSNHASDPTYGITQYQYDALSRTIKTIKQDGSFTQARYNDPPGDGAGSGVICTTAIDEAGKQRQVCNDALGRMVKVLEPNPAPGNSNPFVTTYQYNARGDMLCIHQKATDTSPDVACTGSTPPPVPVAWRQRFFTYDSLSHLLTANNPENNNNGVGNVKVTYGYDDDGRMTSKMEPAPNQSWGTASPQMVTINYTYDALNRLLDTTYSDGTTPKASFRYDYSSFQGQIFAYSIGRAVAALTLDSSNNVISSNFVSYEQMGRAARTTRCNLGVSGCKQFTAFYDKSGDLTSLIYPGNNFTVTYGYDNAARLISATDSNGVIYAQTPTILAAGAIQEFTATNFNNNKYHVDFNNRLQPIEMWTGTSSGAGALFDKTYSYNPPNVSQMNNGNVYTVTNVKDDTRTQSFTYDVLNRLASAGDKTHWANTYTYDAWGNLTNKTPGAPAGENLNATADSHNHLSGMNYDAAGNVTNDGLGGTFVYDAENRITATAGVTYTYDAGGRRIKKSTGVNYWYGPSGAVLAETDSSGIWTNYIFFSGRLLARNVNGDIKYYISDHLHSTAMFVDKAGTATAILDDNDFYPWGGLVPGLGMTTSNNTIKFTGKYRDAESNLDYFGARYYSSTNGRFMSPDWAAKPTTVPYAEFGDPQSLNLYAYVRNSPVVRIDADGHNFAGWDGAYADKGAGLMAFDKDDMDDDINFTNDHQPLDIQTTLIDQGDTILVGVGSDSKAQSSDSKSSGSKKPTTSEIKQYVTEQATKFKIPVALALAVVAKESFFKVDAKGGKGEVGLMQILPSNAGKTFRDSHGKTYKLDFKRAETDWKYNVRAGLSILHAAYKFGVSHDPTHPIEATFAYYNDGKLWAKYSMAGTAVHDHVFGHCCDKNGFYVKGYMDYYHEQGGK